MNMYDVDLALRVRVLISVILYLFYSRISSFFIIGEAIRGYLQAQRIYLIYYDWKLDS